jgi:hypothetical protein
MQRHHLLPRSLANRSVFGAMFEALGKEAGGACRPLEDFRSNGLLLPCNETAALAFAMPLHRGPHRSYTEMVGERVGQVEKGWSALKRSSPRNAALQAQMRLSLLQGALRRLLLDARHRRPLLNRRDPGRPDADFDELDAIADRLWDGTARSLAAEALATEGLAPQPMPARTASSSRAV